MCWSSCTLGGWSPAGRFRLPTVAECTARGVEQGLAGSARGGERVASGLTRHRHWRGHTGEFDSGARRIQRREAPERNGPIVIRQTEGSRDSSEAESKPLGNQ